MSSDGGVKCEDCGELPSIVKQCGDNGSCFNGCAYRLECACGGKGQEFLRSEYMAILHWESVGFKKQNAHADGLRASSNTVRRDVGGKVGA